MLKEQSVKFSQFLIPRCLLLCPFLSRTPYKAELSVLTQLLSGHLARNNHKYFPLQKDDNVGGRAMAQAASRRPPTAEARVRSRVSPCGICGGQSGTGTGFSPEYLSFPLSISFHRCSSES